MSSRLGFVTKTESGDFMRREVHKEGLKHFFTPAPCFKINDSISQSHNTDSIFLHLLSSPFQPIFFYNIIRVKIQAYAES